MFSSTVRNQSENLIRLIFRQLKAENIFKISDPFGQLLFPKYYDVTSHDCWRVYIEKQDMMKAIR